MINQLFREEKQDVSRKGIAGPVSQPVRATPANASHARRPQGKKIIGINQACWTMINPTAPAWLSFPSPGRSDPENRSQQGEDVREVLVWGVVSFSWKFSKYFSPCSLGKEIFICFYNSFKTKKRTEIYHWVFWFGFVFFSFSTHYILSSFFSCCLP